LEVKIQWFVNEIVIFLLGNCAIINANPFSKCPKAGNTPESRATRPQKYEEENS
jgi:hypothetical protein